MRKVVKWWATLESNLAPIGSREKDYENKVYLEKSLISHGIFVSNTALIVSKLPKAVDDRTIGYVGHHGMMSPDGQTL